MDKETLKRIPFFVSAGLAFITGLLFTILGDLLLKSGSPWLIGSVLLAFGCAVCEIISEMFKEKKILSWILKGLALALALAFIGYSVAFHNGIAQSTTKRDILAHNENVFIVLLVFGCLTAVAQIAEIVLCATLKEE